MKYGRLLIGFCLVLSSACGGLGSGCDPNYQYPIHDPQAAPIQNSMRVRLTQHGFDTVLSAVPDLFASVCSGGNGLCSTRVEQNRTWLDFYLGSPNAPITFSQSIGPLGSVQGTVRAGETYAFSREFNGSIPFVTADIERRPYCDDTGGQACVEMLRRGLGSTGDGFCRDPDSAAGCNHPETDYCCGDAASNFCNAAASWNLSCSAARSSISLDAQALSNHIHVDLLDDNQQGDGFTITLGCNKPASQCNNADYIAGSAAITLGLDSATVGDGACFLHNDNSDHGFQIKTLKINVRPQVVLNEQGEPILKLDTDGVTVQDFKVDLSLDVDAAEQDPNCYDEAWSTFGQGSEFQDCNVICGVGNALQTVVAGLIETGPVGTTLARTIAGVLVDQLNGTGLSGSGNVALNQLLSGVVSRFAKPMGFRVAAHDHGLSVDGPNDAKGLNIDVDVGFAGDHSVCAPVITTPDFTLAALPDLGSVVASTDPVTQLPDLETFDLAIALGDAIFGKAGFELFDTGSLCLRLSADKISALAGGAFTPTLGLLGILAPGLNTLAAASTPVDFALSPTEAPTFHFGTGSGEGSERDSHIQLTWNKMRIEFWPLRSDAYLRTLAFFANVELGVTLMPTPAGAIQVMIDRVNVDHIEAAYDEIGLGFDGNAISGLLGAFLPQVLNGQPIVIDPSTLGALPFIPKLRAVSLVGEEQKHLGIFATLCRDAELTNPENHVCYDGSRVLPQSLSRIQRARTLRVQEPFCKMVERDRIRVMLPELGMHVQGLELAYRFDDATTWFSFRKPDALGGFVIEHPLLRLPGLHRVTFMLRESDYPFEFGPERILTSVSGTPACSFVKKIKPRIK